MVPVFREQLRTISGFYLTHAICHFSFNAQCQRLSLICDAGIQFESHMLLLAKEIASGMKFSYEQKSSNSNIKGFLFAKYFGNWN